MHEEDIENMAIFSYSLRSLCLLCVLCVLFIFLIGLDNFGFLPQPH